MTEPYGDGSITFAWAGEERTFNIGKIKSLRELQAVCNAGPMEVLMRLEMGTWRVEDYREVIRIGLLGAGVASPVVAYLIKHYVDEGLPPVVNRQAARAILSCGLAWPKDDALGESRRENREMQSSESSSPDFTEPERPSDSRHDMSMN